MMPFSILYLHETARVSGAENSLLNLVRRIDRARFNPVFACPDNGPFPDKLKKIGIDTYPVTFPPLRRVIGALPAIRKFCRIIKERDIRLVHSNSIRTHIYGAIAARYCAIPIVWHQRNLITSERIDPDRFFSNLADKIICNSRAIADRFLKSGKLPPKVEVIYNGVDTEIFHPSSNGGRVREEFKINPDEIVIGIASRFNVSKGHDTYLRAAKILLSDMPDIARKLRFLIVGGPVFEEDAAREKELIDLADRLKIRDRVVFAGFREEMPEIYRAIDILVLSSDAEPCGRVILEAMASGKAVVATNSGGTPELVEDNKTGLLFNAGDAKDLALKLAVLIKDKGLAERMGLMARRRIEENFSIEKNVSRIQEIYLGLIKK